MDILLETLGGLVWLLIGFLGVVAFGFAAREGTGLYGDPSPPPNPQGVLVLSPAEARAIEAAQWRLTELRRADARSLKTESSSKSSDGQAGREPWRLCRP